MNRMRRCDDRELSSVVGGVDDVQGHMLIDFAPFRSNHPSYIDSAINARAFDHLGDDAMTGAAIRIPVVTKAVVVAPPTV